MESDNYIQRLSADNKALIPNGAVFEKTGGFFIWLPSAVIVHHQTWGEQEHNHTLGEGYHPIKMKKIYADNASVVYAIW